MINHSKTIRLLASIACLTLFHIAKAETAEGRWSGDIALPGQSLAIHVELSQREDQTWSGAISIPAQNLKNFLIQDPAIDRPTLKRKLLENWQRSKTALSESQLQLLGLSDARVQQNIEVASSAWFRSLIRINPMSHFEKLALPTLALFGETDLQVEPHSNLAAFRDAMRSAENSHAHAEIKAGLNHLFQPSETGTPSEYGTIDLTFDPITLQQIASWITERSNS